MIIFNDEFIQLSIENDDYMFIKYKKFCPSEVFRAFWVKMPDYILKYQIYKFLIQSHDMGVIAPKDQKWHAEEIASRIESNLTQMDLRQSYVAIVTKGNIFAESFMKFLFKHIHEMDPNFQRYVEYFDSDKKAINWLMNAQ